MQEEWKEIPGFPGYWISNYGQIRGLRGFLLKSHVRDSTGYCVVSLSRDNHKSQKKLHRLILETFIGYSSLEINHKDGNKQNNCLDNLEYVTRRENAKHAANNGLMPHGEIHYGSKLTSNEIIKIRNLYGLLTLRDLAQMFHMSLSAVEKIVNHKSWKHV